MGEEKFTECEEVYKVLGRIVVVLKEAQRPVTNDSIQLMLHSYSSLNSDAHQAKIYAAAKRVMR